MTAARADAMAAHWERFRVDPPLTILVGEADEPALIAAMDAAVARGHPLTKAEVLAVVGVKDPGPDPDSEQPLCI